MSGLGLSAILIASMPIGGVAAPVVSSVNKTNTRTQGGVLMTVTGTGFTGATSCAFGGTNGTSLTVVNDTTITVVTPTKAAGVHAVVVTGPGGASNADVTAKFVNPSSIFAANLKRWYSASYAAGVWTDESGNANTSQATAGKRPTASTLAGTADRPATHVAVLFDGTDDGLNMGGASDFITISATVGVIIAADATQNTESNILSKNYGAAAWMLCASRTGLANKAAFGCGGSTTTELAVSAASVNDGAVRRLIGTNDLTTSRLYVNGTVEADTGGGGVTTGTLDYNAIGCAMADEATTDYHYKGKVAEVVIADVEASAGQRAELDAYLRDCAGQAS